MRSVETVRRLAGVVLGIGVALGAGTGWAKEGVEPPSRHEVRKALHAVIDAGLPAVGLVITTPKRGTVNLSHGYANLEREFPRMRLRERWRIAGVSQAFTGAVVLKLVGAGQLGLDDTIAQRVPGLLPNAGAVTVRQLLGHASGLVDFRTTPGYQAAVELDPKATLTPQQLVGFVADLPLAFPPGSAFGYSETNAAVLGLIVEAATGTPFADALAAQVAAPLALDRTFLPDQLDMPRPRTRGYDFPVLGAGNPRDVTHRVSPTARYAASGMISTLLETGRFLRARMSGRAFGDALVDASIADLRPGQSEPKGPGRNSAGLGIFEYDIPECGTLYGYTGEILGYRAFAAATRSGRRSIVSMINVSNLDETQETRLAELWRLAACRALQAP
jgi:D-alanyl-D-alanine carboxypeptidase